MDKKTIEHIINKCITIAEMHTQLDNLTSNEKELLISHIISEDLTEYHQLQEHGTEDEIFKYERQLFNNTTKRQRDNILKYLSDFNEKTYTADDDVGYPNNKRGKQEAKQETLQEQQNDYKDDIEFDVKTYWTGGFYDDIQNYILNGKLTGDSTHYPPSVQENIINATKNIQSYIKDSVGLGDDTILYRGGHWDIGLKTGDVATMPLLASTSYSEKTAYEIGIGQSITDFDSNNQPIIPENRYMITVYAPKGTKGMMVNAPGLANTFPEHEYLLGKNQKYIVVDVDDTAKTAVIKLINE